MTFCARARLTRCAQFLAPKMLLRWKLTPNSPMTAPPTFAPLAKADAELGQGVLTITIPKLKDRRGSKIRLKIKENAQ